MSTQKGRISFPLVIIAIIIGAAILREFDFKTLRFEKTALGLLYTLTFFMCVYFIVRGAVKKG